MIEKKHFLAQIEKLEVIYDEKMPAARLMAYYDVLSPDFTNEQFEKALNMAIKNSFKFPPPIAAFYKTDPSQPEARHVNEPVTAAESKVIRGVLEQYGLV